MMSDNDATTGDTLLPTFDPFECCAKAEDLADDLKRLQDNEPDLVELNWSHRRICYDGAMAFAEALQSNTSLTEIDLSRNNIGADGVNALSEVLKSNTSLTGISLSYNDIGADGAKALSEALKSNTSLTKIHLTNNNIGADGANALSEALKSNASLTDINLASNNIGTDGAKTLSEVLKSNTSLTKIHLTSNDIGADGANALSEALKSNTSLTDINLTSNNIGTDGAKALSEVLKSNTSLTKINLAHNDIDADGAKALSEALKSNTSLTEINLTSNNIGVDGRKALSEALKSNTSLISVKLNMSRVGDDLKSSIESFTAANREVKQHQETSCAQLSFYIHGFPTPNTNWRWTTKAWEASSTGDGRVVQVILECIRNDCTNAESLKALKILFETGINDKEQTMLHIVACKTSFKVLELLQFCTEKLKVGIDCIVDKEGCNVRKIAIGNTNSDISGWARNFGGVESGQLGSGLTLDRSTLSRKAEWRSNLSKMACSMGVVMQTNMKGMRKKLKGVLAEGVNVSSQLGSDTVAIFDALDKCEDRKRKLEVEIGTLSDGNTLSRKRSNIKLIDNRIQKLYDSLE